MQQEIAMEHIVIGPLQHAEAERRALGDRHDFTQLMENHGQMVHSLVLRLVRKPDVADDLTQEVFLHALERADQYDEFQGTVRQWLAGIARHSALDYLKSAAERRRGAQPAPELAHTGPSAEAELMEFDRQREVRDALVQLEQPQRELVQLAYFEGLSQTAIATRLDEPLGTVKGRMRAALRRLRFVLSTNRDKVQ